MCKNTLLLNQKIFQTKFPHVVDISRYIFFHKYFSFEQLPTLGVMSFYQTFYQIVDLEEEIQ